MPLHTPKQTWEFALSGDQRIFRIHPHIAEKRGTLLMSRTFGHTVWLGENPVALPMVDRWSKLWRDDTEDSLGAPMTSYTRSCTSRRVRGTRLWSRWRRWSRESTKWRTCRLLQNSACSHLPNVMYYVPASACRSRAFGWRTRGWHGNWRRSDLAASRSRTSPIGSGIPARRTRAEVGMLPCESDRNDEH